MQEEKDYLVKEIKKIVSIIFKIITKETLEENNEELENSFQNHFGKTTSELARMETLTFKNLIKENDSSILEALFNLFYSRIKDNADKKLYVEKSLILLNLVEEKEKTFSSKRNKIRIELENIKE